jgi:hypothetical protein
MTMWRRFESIASDVSEFPGAEPTIRAGRSRRRPWRQGFATQTVIETIEDSRSYRSFERAIIASFGPRSLIELELIHRLASLLWRLRRASAIETALFQMQTNLKQDSGDFRFASPKQIPFRISDSDQIAPNLHEWPTTRSGSSKRRAALLDRSIAKRSSSMPIAQCFIRLANLDPSLLEQAGAYEARLWRQAAQTILILDAMRKPAPQTRLRFRRPSFDHFSKHSSRIGPLTER